MSRNTNHDPLYAEIGRLLRKARKDKGLSQDDVADMIGVKRTSLVYIESATYRPMVLTLVQLCDVLGLSLDALIDEARGAAGPRLAAASAKPVAARPILRHTAFADHVLYRIVAAELREIRTRNHLTQPQVAKAVSIAVGTFAAFEQARNRVTLLTYVRVCRALNVRPGDLLNRVVDLIDGSNISDSEAIGWPLVGEGSSDGSA